MRFKNIILLFFILIASSFIYAQINEQQLKEDIIKYRAENNLPKAAGTINKLAFYFWETEKLDKAVQTFEQSVAINKEIGNDNALKAIYSNMGMIYSDMGQLETSVVYFRKSLLISNKQNNKQDIGNNLINIAVALKNLKRLDEAAENAEEALNVFVEIANKKMMRTCYGTLADIYEELGESQKSMEYFNLYASFQKQIQQEEVDKQKQEASKKVAEASKKVEKVIKEKVITEKKLIVTRDSLQETQEINKLKTLQIEKQQADLKNQQLITLMVVIGLVFVLIVAIFILKSYREKKKHNEILEHRNAEIKKQNEEIKEKNLKIEQSINYAKTIQGALLPDKDNLKKIFPESFIFFSPRDVVSGDFYWFTTVVKNLITYKIVAAVDCTGHGVPGAFMSMLGVSFFNEIVLDNKIVSPDVILEHMHEKVVTSLKQKESGNTDGMDMTVCVYDEKNKKLQFAGAANPLVYIQNNELKNIKGDFFGVGGRMKTSSGEIRKFKLHTFDINEPTTCYIFSDGFSDQFGGENGKKFLLKKFKQLLFDISSKSMQGQYDVLKKTLYDWHGDKYKRVDDILVIGFRI
jgi:serine phosphatase RsbU (regulator of sigma subunit)